MQIIVLNTIKYGDKAFVVQCYSKEGGRCSLFLRGTGKNSKYRAWLHRMSILDVELLESRRGMQVIREMLPVRELCSIRSDIVKGAIAIFMSEIILKSVREVEESSSMYAFLYMAANILEDCGVAEIPNFPVYFLAHFCRVLGFEPQDNYSPHRARFSPQRAEFVMVDALDSSLFDEEISILFHRILSASAISLGEISSNGNARYRLASRLADYLSMHLGTGIELKSLDVLHELCR